MRKLLLLATAMALTVVAASAAASVAADPTVRSLDGSGNNLLHPTWGQVGTLFPRLAAPNYADGVSKMVEPAFPRYVSNRIFDDLGQNVFSENDISQWGWTWAQFTDHTMDLGDETPAEEADIPFDPNDPLERFKDDFPTPENPLVQFARTPAAAGTGVNGVARQQVNTVSSYIDAWNVYGGTASRLEWLRRGSVDSTLADNRATLLMPNNYLPRKDARGDVATSPAMDLFGAQVANPADAVVTGDVRANENAALTALQTLFAREHNRVVSLLPSTLSDEDKFQIARRIVGAEEQYITFTQFLPAMGVQLPAYTGYDPTVNPSITNEFATVGFRGHSLIHGEVEPTVPAGKFTQVQLDSFEAQGIEVERNGNQVTLVVPLALMFGNPDIVEAIGLGPWLRGLAGEREYKDDEMIDDSLRSTLFEIPKPGALDPTVCNEPQENPDCFNVVSDLGAIDVERGRDHGMPLYNDLRAAYGLPRLSSFTQVTGESTAAFPSDPLINASDPIDDPNILDFTSLRDRLGHVVPPGAAAAENTVVSATRRTTLAARLKAIYGSVDDMDSFVGMSVEPHVPGTEFGPPELVAWKKQFQALRDGDRFFYLNDPQLPAILATYGIDYRHTLGDVIEMNTGTNVQPDVFKVPDAADTTAPTVSVTAPTGGSNVSGTVTLTASAADPGSGIEGLQFLVDGAPLGDELAAGPFTTAWDTSSVAAGPHAVGAVARDGGGNVAVASPVTVNVGGGLVAGYGFDEGSGNAVGDASGNGNTGTLRNTAWAPGKFGDALAFDGASSWVTIPDAASLDLTSGMTLEAWVKPSALGSQWRNVLFKEQPGGMVYSLYANEATGHPIGQVDIGGEQNAIGPSSLPTGSWSHVAVTYDGSQLTLYVNGTPVASRPQTGAIPVSNGVLHVGGDSVWGEWFSGAIDEVRVYSRALSQAQIQADMAAPVGPSPVLVGSSTIQPDANPEPAGQAEAFPATAAAARTLHSASVYVDPTSTATRLVVGVYSDAGSHPGTLLGQGAVDAPAARTWAMVPLPAVPLAAGQTYWLALLAPSGTLVFHDRCCSVAGTGPTETSSQATLTALPATWSTGSVFDDAPMSLFGAG